MSSISLANISGVCGICQKVWRVSVSASMNQSAKDKSDITVRTHAHTELKIDTGES